MSYTSALQGLDLSAPKLDVSANAQNVAYAAGNAMQEIAGKRAAASSALDKIHAQVDLKQDAQLGNTGGIGKVTMAAVGTVAGIAAASSGIPVIAAGAAVAGAVAAVGQTVSAVVDAFKPPPEHSQGASSFKIPSSSARGRNGRPQSDDWGTCSMQQTGTYTDVTGTSCHASGVGYGAVQRPMNLGMQRTMADSAWDSIADGDIAKALREKATIERSLTKMNEPDNGARAYFQMGAPDEALANYKPQPTRPQYGVGAPAPSFA